MQPTRNCNGWHISSSSIVSLHLCARVRHCPVTEMSSLLRSAGMWHCLAECAVWSDGSVLEGCAVGVYTLARLYRVGVLLVATALPSTRRIPDPLRRSMNSASRQGGRG